jgi:hypothetical protein
MKIASVAIGSLMLLVSATRAQDVPDEARKQLVEALGGQFVVYRDKVQDELKVTDDQKRSLMEKFSEHVEATMKTFDKLKDLKPEEREKEMQQHRKASDEKLSATLKDVLDEKQRTRLFQIQVQQAGVFALLGENELFLPMKITVDQRKQFAGIVRDMQKKIEPLMKEAQSGGNPEVIRPKAMKIRQEHSDKLESLLSKAQKEKWKEIMGKPFDLGD